MDSIFQNFGIYDFLGVWGPGAITVTYFMFTLHDWIVNVFKVLSIDQMNLSQVYIIIILYTAVAYFIGVILHEVGKIIWNIPFDRLKNKVKFKEYNPICPIRKIEEKTVDAITTTIDLDEFYETSFDKAISYLKYNNNISTKRIDLYHSVYAFSRSMLFSFAIHFFITLFSPLLLDPNWLSLIFTLVIDAAIGLMFYVRAYRYFMSWTKNVYIQYFFEKPTV